MSEGAPPLDARLYFGALEVLLVESNDLESEVLAQVFGSFKVRNLTRLGSTSAAQAHLGNSPAQLIVIGAAQQTEGALDELDFVRWVRQSKTEPIRLASIILLTGHTLQANVVRARDCGASFVIAKPITPRIVYERITWLARNDRAFIDSPTYVGPDRRFQKIGPPPGTEGRRRDDLSLQVGEAKAPNLSQSEIDAMLGGKGMARL